MGVQKKATLFEQLINWINQFVNEKATLNVFNRKVT